MKNLNRFLTLVIVFLLPQVGKAGCEGLLINGRQVAEKTPGPIFAIHHYWAPPGSSREYYAQLMAAGEQNSKELAREYDALNGRGWQRLDVTTASLENFKGKTVKGFYTSVGPNRSDVTSKEFEGQLVEFIKGRDVNGPDFRFASIERDGVTEIVPFSTLTHLLIEEKAMTLRQHLKGPAAYTKLFRIFERNRGHFSLGDALLDHEMIIRVHGENGSNYSSIDSLELSFLDHDNPISAPMSNGWKEGYIHRPRFNDWKQAVKEKLFGEDYVRLEVYEYETEDGSMVYKVSERMIHLGFKGDPEHTIQFSMKVLADGKIISIQGSGNNLAFKAGELKFGGVNPIEMKDSPY